LAVTKVALKNAKYLLIAVDFKAKYQDVRYLVQVLGTLACHTDQCPRTWLRWAKVSEWRMMGMCYVGAR